MKQLFIYSGEEFHINKHHHEDLNNVMAQIKTIVDSGKSQWIKLHIEHHSEPRFFFISSGIPITIVDKNNQINMGNSIDDNDKKQ